MSAINIFDVVNDIRCRKVGNMADHPSFREACRSAFALQRWVSMAAPDMISVMNATTNRVMDGFECGSVDMYAILMDIVPKRRYSGYKYHKAAKVETNVDEVVASVAEEFEISHREAKMMVDMCAGMDVERRRSDA